MVLMSVPLPVGKDDGRIEITFDALEAFLNVGTLKGKIPIPKIQDFDLLIRNFFKEVGGTVPCLGLASSGSTKDYPSDNEVGDLGGNAQNRSAATDLNVVRMSP
jgi:hypothetical protein